MTASTRPQPLCSRVARYSSDRRETRVAPVACACRSASRPVREASGGLNASSSLKSCRRPVVSLARVAPLSPSCATSEERLSTLQVAVPRGHEFRARRPRILGFLPCARRPYDVSDTRTMQSPFSKSGTRNEIQGESSCFGAPLAARVYPTRCAARRNKPAPKKALMLPTNRASKGGPSQAAAHHAGSSVAADGDTAAMTRIFRLADRSLIAMRKVHIATGSPTNKNLTNTP
ncbi:hypothetical protein MMX123_02739 [Microbacterium sp. MM2322]